MMKDEKNCGTRRGASAGANEAAGRDSRSLPESARENPPEQAHTPNAVPSRAERAEAKAVSETASAALSKASGKNSAKHSTENTESFPVVVALDFETADNGADSACALGMVRIENNRIADRFYALIRPPRPRVWYTYIHGITWDMVRGCPTFGELWPECAAFVAGASALVAHNAPFDRSVLYGSCARYGLTPPDIPFLCTVRGARRVWRLPHNRLSDVCAHLGIELNHHNAASDALAAGLIYLRCRESGLPAQVMLSGPPTASKSR